MEQHKTSLEQLATAATNNAQAASKNAEFSKLNALATEKSAMAANMNAEAAKQAVAIAISKERARISVKVNPLALSFRNSPDHPFDPTLVQAVRATRAARCRSQRAIPRES